MKKLIYKGLILSCIVLFTMVSLDLTAQDRNDASWLTWYQFKYQIGLKNAWSLTLDNQHRRQDLINHSSQQVFRPGLAYQFKNDVKLTVGPALFWHNINGNSPVYRFEIRPYTFLEWKQALGKTTIIHRSRFELRYNQNTQNGEIIDGYRFNYRAGHKLGISIPIQFLKSQDYALELYDEVLINFGERITVNHLDQNRMYLGLKRKVNDRISLKLGYMYVFFPTSNPERFTTQHILVLGLGLK